MKNEKTNVTSESKKKLKQLSQVNHKVDLEEKKELG